MKKFDNKYMLYDTVLAKLVEFVKQASDEEQSINLKYNKHTGFPILIKTAEVVSIIDNKELHVYTTNILMFLKLKFLYRNNNIVKVYRKNSYIAIDSEAILIYIEANYLLENGATYQDIWNEYYRISER